MSGETIIAAPDAFGQFHVKELTEADFYLGSATPTMITSPLCHIVLFYEPSTTDPNLIEIWKLLARDIAGPVIASVNTSARREVMRAFMATAADIDNPLYDFTGFGLPTIMVYRSRWPQAYYNGELSYDAIHKWILVLACKPGYFERDSYFHGVSSSRDVQAIETRIENFPYPTSSRDFTSDIGEGTRGTPAYGGEDEEGYAGEEEEGLSAEGEEEGLASDSGEEEGQFSETPTDVGFFSKNK